LLAVCTLIGTTAAANRRLTFVLASAGVVTIVVSQQRTVWVAALAVVLVLLLRGSASARIKGLAGAFVVGAAALALAVTGKWSLLNSEVGLAAIGTGTYDGRVAGWRALWDQAFSGGFEVVWFGRPFGSGFGRYEAAGVWVEYAPHNFYLTMFLRAGLIGLAALVWFLFVAIKRSLTVANGGWVTAMWVALAIMCWTYTLPWFLLPIPVIALSAPMVASSVRATRAHSAYRRIHGPSVQVRATGRA